LPGYDILGEIHSGGQGVVYRAIQKATKRTVAVKMLLHGPYATDRDRHYFEREVELAARLQHRNIVTVYESGVTQGRYYFAMEYVDGQPLDRYVRSANLSTREVMKLFTKVCDAAAYAHQRGVIHRDLKPSNILVDSEGEPHILDFGLAKLADNQGAPRSVRATATMTGQIVGTLAYMSPEQAAGHSSTLDVRTDVYSLGVILYQLLTGQFPYEVRGSTLEVLRNIQEAEPVRPSKVVRHLDSDIQAIILKALAKESDRRYQSAVELRGDVEYWLQGLPITAKSTSSLYVLRKLMTKHWYATAVVGLLLVIILGFGIVSFDFYRAEERAHNESVRAAELNRAMHRERDEMAEMALRQIAAALRQSEMTWVLLSWHQGRMEEVKMVSQTFPKDSREVAAVAFLLDPRPVSAKAGPFRDRLGRSELGFAEYIIGEHYLRDGNPGEAAAAFRRCIDAGREEWFTGKAGVRLKTRTPASKPGAVSQNLRRSK
jgi:predicted Ser/Thr protein kinase